MSYLFELSSEPGDVLRIGQTTISVEHNGDGPFWRTLPNGELDPIYPYFSIIEIEKISEKEIDRIGELVKDHIRKRKRTLDSNFPEVVFRPLESTVRNQDE